jgi:hypothetical protein
MIEKVGLGFPIYSVSEIGSKRRGANLRIYRSNGGERRRRMGQSVLVDADGRRRVVLRRAAMLAFSSSSWRHGLSPGWRISASRKSNRPSQVTKPSRRCSPGV